MARQVKLEKTAILIIASLFLNYCSGNGDDDENGNGNGGTKTCQVTEPQSGDGANSPYRYDLPQDCTIFTIDYSVPQAGGDGLVGDRYFRIAGLGSAVEWSLTTAVMFSAASADADEVMLFYFSNGAPIGNLPLPADPPHNSIRFVKSDGLSQEKEGGVFMATAEGQFDLAASSLSHLESLSITMTRWKDGILQAPEDLAGMAENRDGLSALVSLTWQNPADGDRSKHEINWTPADGNVDGGTSPVTLDANAGQVDIVGLQNGVTYQFSLYSIASADDGSELKRSNAARVSVKTIPVVNWDPANPPGGQGATAKLEVELGETVLFYCSPEALANIWYVSLRVFKNCNRSPAVVGEPPEPVGRKIGECLAGATAIGAREEIKRSSETLSSAISYERGMSYYFVSAVPSENPMPADVPFSTIPETSGGERLQCDDGLKLEISVAP